MFLHRKAGLAVLLTGALLTGTVTCAFADTVEPQESRSGVIDATGNRQSENDANKNSGPGVSGTSPSQENTIPAGSQEAETTTPAEPQTGETGDLTDEQAAQLQAEQEAAQQEAAQLNNPLIVPEREPRLQSTALSISQQNWSAPFVNDQEIITDSAGFSGISTFMENIHGDLLYRTYSTANGWSQWVLNGQQTDHCSTMVPVEAIQYRFKGPVADKFDLYYMATLSDGTQTGWGKNGQSVGTMGQGLYMTGYRLAFFRKGTEVTVNTGNTLKAAYPDGVQPVDGMLRYIHGGDGSNFTGWGWVENTPYYFQDSYPVTGWQYIDGFKYYFSEDGRLVTDVEPLLPAGGPYMLKINKQMNCLTVYAKDGENGFIIPVKAFLTSVGDDTPVGTFKTPEKYRWRLMIHDLYTQYATRLGAGLPILIHSIIYDRPDPFTVWASTYNNLGIARSAGCIRLATSDSKWIYDNCAIGTTVTVYNSPDPGPFERPTILYEIPFEQTWDPTDPNVTQEMIAAETARIIAKFNPN